LGERDQKLARALEQVILCICCHAHSAQCIFFCCFHPLVPLFDGSVNDQAQRRQNCQQDQDNEAHPQVRKERQITGGSDRPAKCGVM